MESGPQEGSGSMDISNVHKSSDKGGILDEGDGSEGGKKATESGRAPFFRALMGGSSLK